MKATALRQLAVCAAVAATFLGPILPVQADYKSTILADTPAGYWRLGDMAVGQAPLLPSGDVAMNSSTVAGGPNGYYLYDTTHPAPGALAGSSDTAAAFDGFKHRVDVPYAALLNGTNFSIELWVRITNAVTRAVSPICSRDTNGQRGYVLFAYNGNTNWQFRTHSSGNATNLTSTNVIQVNEWTHLVGTFDGTRMRLYVNGAEAATPVTNTAFTPNTAAPLRLGAANNHTLAGDNFWPGSLDEVAVYTNALSATQVTAHYQNGTNASRSVAYETLVLSDGPVAYWRLNEAAYAGTTSPLAIQNAGSAGPAANGVILGITNSAVGIPFTTNGVIGGVSGALAGDSDPAVGFNGRDGRIDVPYNAALNPAKFTVEAWAYVPLFYRDYHTILSSRDDSSVGAKPSGFIFYANTNNTWQFWNGTGSGYATLSAVNTLVVTNGQWNHLVGVYDGTNKYFYVNGDLVGFAGNVSYLPNAARPLRIGGGANETQAGNYFLAGGVDEVAVFGQPLGQDRILAHYQAARGSLPPATMPPTFTVQPQNTTNHSLQTITLTAGAIGSLPLALQWYYVSPDLQTTNVLSAGTNNTLVFSPTATSHTGWYYAVATNPAGTSTSTMVYLEIRPPQAPTLVADVSAVPVYVGGTARLPVIVEGTPPISYQWRSNAVNLVGETNTSLVISNAQVAYGTVRYSLVLSNALGVTTSAEGSLNVLTAPASTYAAVITNLQPMAYWRLGEDAGSFAYDYWQGNNGLYQNAIPNMPPGALADDDDGACLFSGTGSRVLVSNTLAFSFTGTNAFTLVTWAQPNTLTGIQRLFSNRTTSPANGGFGLGFRDASRIRFTAFGVADVDSSVGSFTMGQWYHIAVVRNGTGVQFYIDGVLKNTGTLANIIASSAYLQLGGNPTGSEYFTGIMDEAAVFNRALSAAEIAALYAGRYGALVAPSIVQDPTSNRLYAGGTARFGVVASGSQPLAYQWKANNVAIAGATNAELVLPSVTLAQNGVNYSVTVANRAGTVTSASAPLTVLAAYGYQAEVASDRPVAHWRLNETAGPTAYDQRGAHNGSAASIYSFGQPGALKDDADAAYGFDGMSTKVEVPYSADLNPATFSVECWARVTGGANTYRAAVSSRDFNQGYVLYAGVANQWQFWTRAPGVAWQPQTGTPVVEGEWAHLVGTFDGTNKNFYVNGQLVASQVNTNYQPNFIRNLRIGAGNNEDDPAAGGIYNFPGDVDEVALYDYPLSGDRVATHYQLGKYSLNTAPLIVQQPAPVTVSVGRSATLSAAAGGSPLLRYQWYKDGAAISGATGAGLGFASTDYSDSGTYMVVVTNSLGLTNSLGAKLAVTPAPLFANVTNGLVLHLKLDNDAQDTSGRGNHGLASGNPTFVPGRLGQALHYRTDTASSVYAYVTLNTPTDLWFSSNVNFSVAYWVRLTGTPSRLPFLSSASGAYGGNGVTFAPATGTGGWAYSLVGSGGIVNTGTGMKAINDGQWHHLVHCFDRAGQGITYLDGARVDARAVSGAGDVDFGNAFCIGQDPSGYFDQNGEADIDDIGIWRRALTEYEALSIYGAAQNGQSFDAYGPVKLLMRSSSTGLELIWQAGTLMEADNVSGPYTPVSGATAPYQKVTPGANQKFYRVQL